MNQDEINGNLIVFLLLACIANAVALFSLYVFIVTFIAMTYLVYQDRTESSRFKRQFIFISLIVIGSITAFSWALHELYAQNNFKASLISITPVEIVAFVDDTQTIVYKGGATHEIMSETNTPDYFKMKASYLEFGHCYNITENHYYEDYIDENITKIDCFGNH